MEKIEVYGEAANLTWALKCKIRMSAIPSLERNEVCDKIEEVENLIWTFEQKAKKAMADEKNTLALEKEANMSDAIPDGIEINKAAQPA